jgi:hypothetical protein
VRTSASAFTFVQDRAVDADGGVGARIIAVAGREVAGKQVPLPQRRAGVAALDCPVEVVPVVEDPALNPGRAGEGERGDRAMGLKMAEEGEGPVKDSGVAVGRDHDRVVPAPRDRVAFVA